MEFFESIWAVSALVVCIFVGGVIGRFYNGQSTIGAVCGLGGPLGLLLFLLIATERATCEVCRGREHRPGEQCPGKPTSNATNQNWTDETFVC